MFFKHFLPFVNNSRIYLDYASSTPLDEDMLDSFPEIPEEVIGANPSALHKEGVLARGYVEAARKATAEALGAHRDEIIYTSGATESDNLAITGSVRAFLSEGIESSEIAVFASSLEHSAVLETLNALGAQNVHIGTIPAEDGVVNPNAIIIPEGIKAVLVSVMYVNNEIGTIQPISAIAKRVRYLRKQFPDIKIYFHVDATQAPLFYSLNVSKLGIDLMTLGATKLYCPKGIGILFKKRNIKIMPVLFGGGQEHGLRPGTEPLDLIYDFSNSLSFAQKNIEKEYANIKDLQIYFEEKVGKIKSVNITAKDKERSPHITHIGIKGIDSELLVIELDARGIAVSAKSACKNEEASESDIVKAIYGSGFGAVRFSFGRYTKKKDLDRAVLALEEVLRKYKIEV